MALTPVLGLNVKLRASLFDPLPQNMNRAGSALSIIYTHSFSISCLSALVAVTCPDTNGGRLGENIYQCYRRVLSSSILSLSAFWNVEYWHCTDPNHHYYTLLHVFAALSQWSQCPWKNLCLLHPVLPMNLHYRPTLHIFSLNTFSLFRTSDHQDGELCPLTWPCLAHCRLWSICTASLCNILLYSLPYNCTFLYTGSP